MRFQEPHDHVEVVSLRDNNLLVASNVIWVKIKDKEWWPGQVLWPLLIVNHRHGTMAHIYAASICVLIVVMLVFMCVPPC